MAELTSGTFDERSARSTFTLDTSGFTSDYPFFVYTCRVCNVPGHYIHECPKLQAKRSVLESPEQFEKPPSSYMCKRCKAVGHHFIRDCCKLGNKRVKSEKKEKPAEIELKPPLAYVCCVCKKPGDHYINFCPELISGGKMGTNSKDQRTSTSKQQGLIPTDEQPLVLPALADYTCQVCNISGDHFTQNCLNLFEDRTHPPPYYFCVCCWEFGASHFSTECPKLKPGSAYSQPQASKPPAGYNCKVCGSSEHFIKQCPIVIRNKIEQRPPPDYVCRMCQGKDHYIKACPQRGSKKCVPPRHYNCGKCGSSEHFSEDCTKVTQALPPPGYICKICQKVGHYIHDCPTTKPNVGTTSIAQTEQELLESLQLILDVAALGQPDNEPVVQPVVDLIQQSALTSTVVVSNNVGPIVIPIPIVSQPAPVEDSTKPVSQQPHQQQLPAVGDDVCKLCGKSGHYYIIDCPMVYMDTEGRLQIHCEKSVEAVMAQSCSVCKEDDHETDSCRKVAEHSNQPRLWREVKQSKHAAAVVSTSGAVGRASLKNKGSDIAMKPATLKSVVKSEKSVSSRKEGAPKSFLAKDEEKGVRTGPKTKSPFEHLQGLLGDVAQKLQWTPECGVIAKRRIFECSYTHETGAVFTGSAFSKKLAKQDLAEKALSVLLDIDGKLAIPKKKLPGPPTSAKPIKQQEKALSVQYKSTNDNQGSTDGVLSDRARRWRYRLSPLSPRRQRSPRTYRRSRSRSPRSHHRSKFRSSRSRSRSKPGSPRTHHRYRSRSPWSHRRTRYRNLRKSLPIVNLPEHYWTMTSLVDRGGD